MKTLFRKHTGLLLGVLLLLIMMSSCYDNKLVKYEIYQKSEFDMIDDKFGYRVETRLILMVNENKYDLIYGDFVNEKNQTYGKLAEQLRDADSMIARASRIK